MFNDTRFDSPEFYHVPFFITKIHFVILYLLKMIISYEMCYRITHYLWLVSSSLFKFELCGELQLTQVVDDSTRGGGILDLIFINNEGRLHRVEVEDTITSDYRFVFLETIRWASVGQLTIIVSVEVVLRHWTSSLKILNGTMSWES